jgi:uncharacterized membrane protein HdeD (DUF308 family)
LAVFDAVVRRFSGREAKFARVRLVMRVLSIAATVVVAYGIAIFLYGIADQVSAMPNGPLWDPSFRTSLRFILIILAFIALVIPAFRTDSPSSQRAQAVFAAAFFAVYVFFKISKLVDPDIPFRAVAAYVAPLWVSIVHSVNR